MFGYGWTNMENLTMDSNLSTMKIKTVNRSNYNTKVKTSINYAIYSIHCILVTN